MPNSLHVLVIGAGAIGFLVGGKLALAGATVTVAGRPRIAEAVRSRGLRLLEPSGAKQIDSLLVTGSIGEAFSSANVPFDLIILTVKSYATASALAEIQAAVAPLGRLIPPILSLQNGVGNEELIAAMLGRHCIFAGNITTPVSVPELGVIQVERAKYGIGIAAWGGEENGGMGRWGDKEKVECLGILRRAEDALRVAGFVVKVYDDVYGMKWTKLLLNIVGNATSAILDEAPDVAFADAAIIDLELAAWRETLSVMRASAIPVLNMEGYPLRLIAPCIRFLPNRLLYPVLHRMVATGRGKKLPSLAIDLSSNKGESEIGWLNGAVVKQGKAVGVATPVNQILTDTLTRLVEASKTQQPRRVIGHEALLRMMKDVKGS